MGQDTIIPVNKPCCPNRAAAIAAGKICCIKGCTVCQPDCPCVAAQPRHRLSDLAVATDAMFPTYTITVNSIPHMTNVAPFTLAVAYALSFYWEHRQHETVRVFEGSAESEKRRVTFWSI